MDSTLFRWLAQILAAGGVILSLCLVAYEMKQAREIALAELYQPRTQTSIDIYLAYFNEEEFFKAMALYSAGEEMSHRQNSIIKSAYMVAFLETDLLYYHWRLGFVPDEEWTLIRSSTIERLKEDELARIAWNDGIEFGQDFAKQIQAFAPKTNDEAM